MLDLTKKEEYLKIKASNDKLLHLFTLIRVSLFIGIIALIIASFTLGINPYLYILIAILLISITFIIFTNKYYKKNIYLKNILTSYLKHEERQKGNLTNNKLFFDKGEDLSNPNNEREKYLIEDIDLFGEHSLYQLMSSCRSVNGRLKLSKALKENVNPTNLNDLTTKANSIILHDDLIKIEALIMKLNIKKNENDFEAYAANLNRKYQPKKKLNLGLIFLYMIDIILIVLACLKIIPLYSLVIIFILNLYYSTFYKDELNSVDSTSMYLSISNYGELLNDLAKLDLSYVDDCFSSNNLKGKAKYFKKIEFLWQVNSFKNNIIFKLVLNGLICFEAIFQTIFNLILKTNSDLKQTLEVIGDLEYIISIANIKTDYDGIEAKESKEISFKGIYNPLIKDCVKNDFTYEKGVILTGSNMSGKTTFLRTMIINLILAMSSSFVFADEFLSPKIEVFSSLRIKDELKEGISTFYQEIKKIRCMLKTDTNLPKICFIDEIFKGTNTLDRIYGAKMLIKKLEELNIKFLISTHDFELCDVDGILNYHFSELYQNNYQEISFDYKIKKGRSESTNAIFLLKSAGVIEG